MPMPIRAGATQTAQSNDVGACCGDTQNLRVPAAHYEPDPPGGGKVFQAGIDQMHILPVSGDGFTVEQTPDSVDEFSKAPCAVRRCWAATPDRFPLTEGMAGPKPEQHASGGEDVEGGGIGCRLHRFPHTAVQNVGAELEPSR